MSKKVVTGILRGLTIVLLVPILTTNSIILSYGLTVDDLRAYIGGTVKQADNTVVVENPIEIESSSDEGNTESDTSKKERLKKDLVGYESQIERRMKESDNTLAIVALVKNAKELKEKVVAIEEDIKAKESLYKSPYSGDTGIEQIIKSTNVLEETIKFDKDSISSQFFDIGFFGDYFFKPVDNSLRLVTPYGYKKGADGNYGSKHLGIDLVAYEGADIRPMFNGIISSVDKDIYGENDTVTMYHGNGLYTVYHHVKVNEGISKGKKISYLDFIAKAVDTTKYEGDKENHILLQVVLDNEYINPLYLFGESGERLYKEWAGKTEDVYAVGNNEYFYYTEEMSVENVNKHLEPEIVYENQATVKDENYQKPNPGILNNIQEELEANGN